MLLCQEFFYFIPSKLDNRLLGRSQAPPLFALSSSGRHRLATLRSRCGGNSLLTGPPARVADRRASSAFRFAWLSPRSISIRQLHVSPRFHLGPIDLVIFEGSYSLDAMGNLILRGASRLDAFSAYPVRT